MSNLRMLIDSGLLAAAAPAVKKPKDATGDGGNFEGAPTTNPTPMGPQELHIHLNTPQAMSTVTPDDDDQVSDEEQDPSADPSDEEQDPSDEDQQPTGATKNASPAAVNVSKTIQDPVGATKQSFQKLAKTKMSYDLAREEAKRNLIGPMQVIKHVAQMHQLEDPMTGAPMAGQNPDEAGGYDQNGVPTNMSQQPGAQQMSNPQNARMGVGASPNLNAPRLNSRVPAPGAATQGAQTQVRPPKMGVGKPGQSGNGTRAGNPSSKGKANTGKSVKVEVKSNAIAARDFSTKKRKKLAKTGAAMPGGGFPIENREDLSNAKQAIGRAKNRAATIRHINERAKALGAPGFGQMAAASEVKSPMDTRTQNKGRHQIEAGASMSNLRF